MNLQPPTPRDLPLRDIHLPPDPSWWPPAPGWWVLCSVACMAAVLGYWLYRRASRKRVYRERIHARLRQLAAQHAHDDGAYAAALHQLLRSAALRYAAGAHHLQGEPWRQVLAQVPVQAATLDALMTLETRMYRPHAEFDRVAVESAVRHWLLAAFGRVYRMEASRA
jgi:hypothetical protein